MVEDVCQRENFLDGLKSAEDRIGELTRNKENSGRNLADTLTSDDDYINAAKEFWNNIITAVNDIEDTPFWINLKLPDIFFWILTIDGDELEYDVGLNPNVDIRRVNIKTEKFEICDMTIWKIAQGLRDAWYNVTLFWTLTPNGSPLKLYINIKLY